MSEANNTNENFYRVSYTLDDFSPQLNPKKSQPVDYPPKKSKDFSRKKESEIVDPFNISEDSSYQESVFYLSFISFLAHHFG